MRGVHLADVSTDSFREIIATGDSPVVYSGELLPRMSALFSMEVSSGSELPVVSCVIPSLLFEEVSLLKTRGLSKPNFKIPACRESRRRVGGRSEKERSLDVASQHFDSAKRGQHDLWRILLLRTSKRT